MALGIKYGDVILGVEYPGLAGWVDDNHNLGELLDQAARSISGVSLRRDARGDRPNDVSLTQPNWASPPGVTPNSLYWPTGAVRWATFYGLVDTAAKDKILEAVGTDAPSELPLVLQDDNVQITTDMWLLPPRPITAHTEQRLWLIPLVDDRWRWQWQNAGDLNLPDFGTVTTWADMFNDLAEEMGISITYDTPDPTYHIPDPTELTRKFENTALLLDAVAQSVGVRIVRRLDGTVVAISAADSEEVLDEQIPAQIEGGGFAVRDTDGTPSHIGGGDHSDIHRGMNYPENLDIAFPYYDDSTPGSIIFADDLHLQTESMGTYVSDVTPVSGTRHTIFTTARADHGGGSLVNSGEVSDLAVRISMAYFAWRRRHYDITWSGIKTWRPVGYDDNAEWFVGSMRPDGSRQVQTRVQSVPLNFGFQEQLSQFADTISHDRDGICSSIWSS